ncbi:glutamine-hydrolyzing carbamoyl-phosphate synthase small subunit [bacterium]|nr:glutamine-hydrolyzing carbamoyl-phosphate synthase small subunit [bacterium]
MKAILMLEDGKIFNGKGFGSEGEIAGEVVFNTSMTGYQEILTDPSYNEQIVTMTYPQIGNYGVNDKDVESKRIQLSGLIVKEYLDYFSNWRAKSSLDEYLKKYNITAISDIDTRELTRHIRVKGAMNGIISTENFDINYLKEKLDDYPGLIGRDLVKNVTCTRAYYYNNKIKDFKYNIIAVDYGIKLNILRCLNDAGFKIKVVPSYTSSDEILRENPDGIFLSNGPGDPAAIDYAIKNISELIGKKPIFGICLGQQLIALALGAKTYKLKFGHHGGNHPVKNLKTGGVEITTQNHGFNVDQESLNKLKNINYKVTHVNLNDGTIEGIEYENLSAFSVQHHPEAGPGPHDSRYIFKKFVQMIENFKAEY